MHERLRIFAATAVGHFANDGTFLLFPLLLVYYIKVPGVSLSILGAMAVMYQLLSAFVSPAVGKRADRSGKLELLMSVGIALEAISILVFGLAFIIHSLLIYSIIALGAILLGLGQAFYHPLGGALITREFKGDAPKYMGINGSIGSVGRTVMPAAATLLIALAGTMAGISLLSIMFFAFAAVIFALFRLDGISAASMDCAKAGKAKANGAKAKLNGAIYRLTASLFFKSAFQVGTVTFIGAYMYLVFAASPSTVGLFLSITFLPAIAGQYTFGVLVERYGNRSMFAITSVLMVLFFLMFLLSENIYVAALLYSAFVFVSFTTFPLSMSYSSRLASDNGAVHANSFVWGFGNILGSSAGIAIISALLFIGISLGKSMWFMMAIGAMAVLSLLVLPKA